MIRPLKFTVVLGNERLITPSGLSLVGRFLERSELEKRSNSLNIEKRSQAQIPNSDILKTYIGMLCQGKPAYESVNEFHEDEEAMELMLGLKKGLPSEATLRQRLDLIGNQLRENILASNISMFTRYGVKVSANSEGYVPLDVDVTPFDNSRTKKDGVSRTYAGYDGYAPIMAYIGTEGFLANAELREGKTHCQKGTPDFLRETIRCAKQMSDGKLLLRLDSGNDAVDNVGVCEDLGVDYIIKRNLRKESPAAWLSIVHDKSTNVKKPREGKIVYIGSFEWSAKIPRINENGEAEKKEMKLRLVYEIIERTITKDGQMLLAPEVVTNMWLTSLGLPDETIINLYHAHGESEQFHSEIKSDMDVERLPSGKFDTNALVLELTIIAYNILRMIGQESLRGKDTPLKRPVKRRRLRTVITNLILIASRITKHARRVLVSLGCSNAWRAAFMRCYARFA